MLRITQEMRHFEAIFLEPTDQPGTVRARIFDLFVQDPRAIEVHAGGLGIGLAVVKDLVQGHDGSVSVTSRGRGLGSSFRVTLPHAKAGGL